MNSFAFRKRTVFFTLAWVCFALLPLRAQSQDQNAPIYPSDQNQTNSQATQNQANQPATQNQNQGQNQGVLPQSASQNASQTASGMGPNGSPNANSAAVQNFLQNRPEVMEQIKRLLVQRLRSEGSLVDEQTITDQMVYDRMQKDPVFRSDAIRTLLDQGYISEDDAQTLLGNTNVPNTLATQGLNAPSQTGRNAQGLGERPGATQSRVPPYDDSALNPKTITQPNPYPEFAFGARPVHPVSRAVEAAAPLWLRSVPARCGWDEQLSHGSSRGRGLRSRTG